MKTENWTSFKKKIYIKGSLETIYRLWATAGGITSWFLSDAEYKRGSEVVKDEEFIAKGDAFVWKWHNWDGSEKGKILKTELNRHIAFTFADGQVDVYLKEENDSILVTLEQSNIPIDEKSKMEIYNGCSNGWAFWLTNLKAFVEHGILLNETEIDLRGIDMSSFQFVNM